MTRSAARFAAIPLIVLGASLVGWGQTAPGSVEPKPYFTEPAISPDRSEIAFSSGGDIWAVAAAGGDARLLVSHPANESQPEYSPDGKTLAFVSDRTGGGDIYLLTLANGDLRRLTFDDGAETLDGWSHDGQWIYFSSGAREIAGNDIYRVRVSGGMPMPVSADRFTNEFASAPSPDGQSIAFSARGNGPSQWWRKVVGEPTSGWIIFTGSATLIDGTTIRMPGTRITSNDGKTMEINPRPVDVPVTRPIGETYTGTDSQLETAVKELLKQIDG